MDAILQYAADALSRKASVELREATSVDELGAHPRGLEAAWRE